MRKTTSKRLICAALSMLLALGSAPMVMAAEETAATTNQKSALQQISENFTTISYADYQARYAGAKKGTATVTVKAVDYVAEMTDDHLLIYGHNMRVGTMFGELDRFRELDYLCDHPIIEIQSIYDEEPTKYVIIAIFDASMNKSHSTYIKITRFNFEIPEEKQSYIDSICARSIFDLPCDATADDQLVTLVTCSYSHPNGRLLVVGRELREDETVEQITEMYRDLK